MLLNMVKPLQKDFTATQRALHITSLVFQFPSKNMCIVLHACLPLSKVQIYDGNIPVDPAKKIFSQF